MDSQSRPYATQPLLGEEDHLFGDSEVVEDLESSTIESQMQAFDSLTDSWIVSGIFGAYRFRGACKAYRTRFSGEGVCSDGLRGLPAHSLKYNINLHR